MPLNADDDNWYIDKFGLLDKSVYEPDVATVANVGVPDRSAYAPDVATVAKLGVPDRSVYAPDVATVANVGLFFMNPGYIDNVSFQSAWAWCVNVTWGLAEGL